MPGLPHRPPTHTPRDCPSSERKKRRVMKKREGRVGNEKWRRMWHLRWRVQAVGIVFRLADRHRALRTSMISYPFKNILTHAHANTQTNTRALSS